MITSQTMVNSTSQGTPSGNYNGSSAEFASVKVEGAGYYNRNSGLHTFTYTLNGFSGTIQLQGSLEESPVDADWFELDTTPTYVLNSSTQTFNVDGLFVWLRVKVTGFTAGTISKILVRY
jgi:hypothetical protein